MHVCMYVCMYVCVYACVYVCVYACVYIYIYREIYIYIYRERERARSVAFGVRGSESSSPVPGSYS